MEGMTKQAQWQWQEVGTSWKGVGIYHVTLTVTSREPLLGTLVIPDGDPARARVEPTELGRAILDCHRSLPLFCPEIQILQYCLMPDHLHSIWYVRRPMEKSIRYVAQGFWRGAKKAGRAYSYLQAAASRLIGGATNESPVQPAAPFSAQPAAPFPAQPAAPFPAQPTAPFSAQPAAPFPAQPAAPFSVQPAALPSLSSLAPASSLMRIS